MAAIAIPYNHTKTASGDYTDHQSSPSSGFKNGSGQPKITYDDPDADVALKSNEGRIFKVESYVLKTHSTHFRNQFKQSGIPHDPIAVDASTKILKGLLDIMHMRPVPSGMVWAYKDKLLKLCDQLGTPSVAERAVFSMHDSVHKDPWGVFALASQRGNVSLAKAALRHLGDTDNGSEKVDKLSLTPQLASGVTLPYLLGLFNAALAAANTHHTHAHTNANGTGSANGEESGFVDDGSPGAINWKVVADKFTPVVG